MGQCIVPTYSDGIGVPNFTDEAIELTHRRTPVSPELLTFQLEHEITVQ